MLRMWFGDPDEFALSSGSATFNLCTVGKLTNLSGAYPLIYQLGVPVACPVRSRGQLQSGFRPSGVIPLLLNSDSTCNLPKVIKQIQTWVF